MTSVLNDSLFEPKPFILGIMGHTQKISEENLQNQVLALILQEVGRVPDRILLPSEGNSSIYLQAWAEALHIPTQVFQADWVRNGKIAQLLRDDRIKKECTHALVFLSPRSKRLEKVAESMVKKGKVVFTSLCNQSGVQLEHWHSEPALASVHAHKSGIKTGPKSSKHQTKSQC
jgi:hypothetical protein